jgi:hypothetical protein
VLIVATEVGRQAVLMTGHRVREGGDGRKCSLHLPAVLLTLLSCLSVSSLQSHLSSRLVPLDEHFRSPANLMDLNVKDQCLIFVVGSIQFNSIQSNNERRENNGMKQ